MNLYYIAVGNVMFSEDVDGDNTMHWREDVGLYVIAETRGKAWAEFCFEVGTDWTDKKRLKLIRRDVILEGNPTNPFPTAKFFLDNPGINADAEQWYLDELTGAQ